MKSSKSRKILIHILIIITIIYGSTIFLRQDLNSTKVCFKAACVNTTIANTDESREIGLMFVKSMPEKSGMLFIFDKPWFYPFRMKNTLIPLDIIRINRDKQIVEIQTAIPCTTEHCTTYGWNQAASYVIEINAGLAQKRWLQTGQEVSGNF